MLGTFAADAGLTAVFGALCFGGRLDLMQIKKFTSREALRAHFRSHPVDCYKITPSLLDLLLQDADMEVILPRKRLILGGEPCPWQLASRVHGMLPKGCVLYNHYGPTETTVGVLTYRFPDDKAEFPAVIPLGRPLAHVQMYLLDTEMREVEQGTTAELYIGGDLVAREYLGKPGLTAEHFLQYRHNEGPVRVYRTGDLVRQLPDGNIEYLERMDDQVKISGYRIELKEIEQAILSAGKIRNCVVLARDNAAGWKRLVGYILPGEGYEKEALMSFLRNRLPAYMIPACWVELAEWPLTFNNKTDRQALPCPNPKEEISVEEGGDTRTVLRAIWSRLLEREVVDTDVEFFELGGDSLLLIQLAFEIKQEFHVSMPAAMLYRSLTIDGVATWLDAKTGAVVREESSAPTGFDPLQASSAERNFYLQKRLHPEESFPNCSLSFQVTGNLDVQRLDKSLATVVGMHESLRTGFFVEQRKVIRRVWEKAGFSLVQEQAGDEDIDEVINRVIQPFDYDRPPLMRAFLIQLKGGGRYFHLDMPHIVSDGKSLEVIMEDVAGQYNNDCPGGHRPGFTDFQQYFHGYQHSRQYLEDAAFWKESLRREDVLLGLGSSSTAKLPRLAGSGVTEVLSAELAVRLNEVAMEMGITRFQFFLAVYYLLLYKITAQSGLTVMVPFNNRYENGSEKMVGLLVNVMPVRLDINAGWTIAELFAHCKQRLLGVAVHQQFPFEKIMEMRTLAGGDAKTLMQTFFGWHGGASVYRLGEAIFRQHVPVRNKEPLPLSVGVFDTDPTPTIRFSALLAAYDPVALRAIAGRYVRLLELILAGGVDRSLSSITNETESLFSLDKI
jgi:acyl carrier protein